MYYNICYMEFIEYLQLYFSSGSLWELSESV